MKDAESKDSFKKQRPQSAIRLSNWRRKQCFNQFLCKNPPNRSFFAIKKFNQRVSSAIKPINLQSGLKKASCLPYFYSKSGSKSIKSELGQSNQSIRVEKSELSTILLLKINQNQGPNQSNLSWDWCDVLFSKMQTELSSLKIIKKQTQYHTKKGNFEIVGRKIWECSLWF